MERLGEEYGVKVCSWGENSSVWRHGGVMGRKCTMFGAERGEKPSAHVRGRLGGGAGR